MLYKLNHEIHFDYFTPAQNDYIYKSKYHLQFIQEMQSELDDLKDFYYQYFDRKKAKIDAALIPFIEIKPEAPMIQFSEFFEKTKSYVEHALIKLDQLKDKKLPFEKDIKITQIFLKVTLNPEHHFTFEQ